MKNKNRNGKALNVCCLIAISIAFFQHFLQSFRTMSITSAFIESLGYSIPYGIVYLIPIYIVWILIKSFFLEKSSTDKTSSDGSQD